MRVYNVYQIPNGEKIPLSFRSQEEQDTFEKERPNFTLLKSSFISNTNNAMQSVITYSKTKKRFFG